MVVRDWINLLQLAGHPVAVDSVLVTESDGREQERRSAVEDDGGVSDVQILVQIIQTHHGPEITGNYLHKKITVVTNQTKNPIKTRIQKTFLGAFLASAALVSPTMLVFFQKSSYR